MKFQFKIILTTLIILIVALVLNSILSLASFEKLYVASLVSTYEIAGKNLKRKIEKSLRFGKPLTVFTGMDKLLKEVRDTNPKISTVSIISLDNKILYHTDKQMIGSDAPIDLPALADQDRTSSRLFNKNYITLVPLLDRSKKLVGFASLSFPRKLVYDKLKKMAFESSNLLWTLIIVTSMLIVLMMSIFIVLPVKIRMRKIGQRLDWPVQVQMESDEPEIEALKHTQIDNGEGAHPKDRTSHYRFKTPPSTILLRDIKQIRNETNRLTWHIYKFLEDAFQTLDDLPRVKRGQQEIAATCAQLEESAEQVRQLIGQSDALSSEQAVQLENLILEKGAYTRMVQTLIQEEHSK